MDERDRATAREQGAHGRVRAAADRDAAAHARDVAALARDQLAALRDGELAKHDAGEADAARAVTGASIGLRAAQDRQRAATARAAAAQARQQSADDREQAADDRVQAQADREALLHQLANAEIDELTGTRTRSAGLEDLDNELERARRGAGPLVVAYVDVVGLKAVNDAGGHAAGDALLRGAAHVIRGHLRSYDIVIRVGGDEFLCVMSGATIGDARRRFETIQAALATARDRCHIRVGFAALHAGDSTRELIRRADEDLRVQPAPHATSLRGDAP